jgi:hypothetical protein
MGSAAVLKHRAHVSKPDGIRLGALKIIAPEPGFTRLTALSPALERRVAPLDNPIRGF